MREIILTCNSCGIEFKKPINEYNRKLKLKKDKFYCSMSCSGKNEENFKHLRKINKISQEKVKGRYKVDEYSPFKPIFNKCKYNSTRSKNRRDREFNLTLEYLKKLWDQQDGKCPFTGFDLELRTCREQSEKIKQLNIKTASIDRIDNNKGYIEGNVRYVSVMFNFARNIFSDEEVVEFAKAVVEHKRL